MRSNSQPVLIALPKALRGMSLEDRLLSYDWKTQFDNFQRVMRSGSFQAVCLDAQNSVLAVSARPIDTQLFFILNNCFIIYLNQKLLYTHLFRYTSRSISILNHISKRIMHIRFAMMLPHSLQTHPPTIHPPTAGHRHARTLPAQHRTAVVGPGHRRHVSGQRRQRLCRRRCAALGGSDDCVDGASAAAGQQQCVRDGNGNATEKLRRRRGSGVDEPERRSDVGRGLGDDGGGSSSSNSVRVCDYVIVSTRRWRLAMAASLGAVTK